MGQIGETQITPQANSRIPMAAISKQAVVEGKIDESPGQWEAGTVEDETEASLKTNVTLAVR